MQVPEGKLWQIVNVSNYSFNESGNLVDIMSGGNVFVGGKETISPDGSSPITKISNSRLPANSLMGLLRSNS